MENGIRVSLEPWQYELLRPYFDEIDRRFEAGEPGAIMAQIFGTKTPGYMNVALLDQETSLRVKAITQAVGDATGETRTVSVYVKPD
jgi:hypothetical protein